MKKPPRRFWTQKAIDYAAVQLGLENKPGMQDWAYEVADPDDLSRYLSFLKDMRGNPDVCFVVADIIFQAFEELGGNPATDPRWEALLNQIRSEPELHAYQIWYWADFGTPLSHAWNIAPEMRRVAAELL